MRSLYEDQVSDDEIGDASPVVVNRQMGDVANVSSTQAIIVVLHGISDTLQVTHVEKKKILPSSSCVFDSLSTPRLITEFNMHVHFPGLLGLISPRTILSAGYGFKVRSGEAYQINLLSEKDVKVR